MATTAFWSFYLSGMNALLPEHEKKRKEMRTMKKKNSIGCCTGYQNILLPPAHLCHLVSC